MRPPRALSFGRIYAPNSQLIFCANPKHYQTGFDLLILCIKGSAPPFSMDLQGKYL
jgi:hypothetical protein